MKVIKKERLKRAVAELLVKANIDLREDVMGLLRKVLKKETSVRSRFILKSIIGNAVIAKREKIPICQDTGLPVIFIEIGNEVKIEGGDLEGIIDEAIREGTRKGLLRESAVEPIFNRSYTSKRAGVVHLKMAQGDKLKLTVLPKGFGCENKTALKMFKPTVALSKIEDFIVDSVKNAGPDACPPFIVGIGIGGTADKACILAKEVLLRKIKNQKSKIKITNQNSKIYNLEKRLLTKINKLNIGPMGLGGNVTALAVNIETYPTHIAGLPVCVNISCHATRSASLIL